MDRFSTVHSQICFLGPEQPSSHFCLYHILVCAWVSCKYILGCLGSIATLTMGVASKLSGVKGGHAAEVEMVADFRINSSIPPIPAGATTKQYNTLSGVKLPIMQHGHHTEQLNVRLNLKHG